MLESYFTLPSFSHAPRSGLSPASSRFESSFGSFLPTFLRGESVLVILPAQEPPSCPPLLIKSSRISSDSRARATCSIVSCCLQSSPWGWALREPSRTHAPPRSPAPPYEAQQRLTILPPSHGALRAWLVFTPLMQESESEVAQSSPTLSDPMDCSMPGSSIHGILRTRALEWGAIAFS